VPHGIPERKTMQLLDKMDGITALVAAVTEIRISGGINSERGRLLGMQWTGSD
jgi:hypothetical protein